MSQKTLHLVRSCVHPLPLNEAPPPTYTEELIVWFDGFFLFLAPSTTRFPEEGERALDEKYPGSQNPPVTRRREPKGAPDHANHSDR